MEISKEDGRATGGEATGSEAGAARRIGRSALLERLGLRCGRYGRMLSNGRSHTAAVEPRNVVPSQPASSPAPPSSPSLGRPVGPVGHDGAVGQWARWKRFDRSGDGIVLGDDGAIPLRRSRKSWKRSCKRDVETPASLLLDTRRFPDVCSRASHRHASHRRRMNAGCPWSL